MRNLVFIISLVLSASAVASYTYVIEEGDYFEAKSLTGTQSILVTGGGGYQLNLFYYSQAVIQDTSDLEEYKGGIWDITAGGYSNITIKDGAIHRITIGSYATAQISGGQIDQIWSSYATPDASRIMLTCNPGYQITYTSGIATAISGTWRDSSAFNIQLVNPSGRSSVFSNMTIIPEPTSLLLLAIGGLLIRRK
jgi:hypothetical protein